MKNFRIAVMLNGAEGIDYFEKLSNLKQIESGLQSNQNQSILYYNLKTINESRPFLFRLAMHFSGHSYAFFLDSVLEQVIRRIRSAITSNDLSRDGTVDISLFGFSEGASLARHFGMEFIKKRLIDNMPNELKKYGIKVRLDAEYLLDSVQLSTPVTVSILSPFSLRNYYPRGYYRLDIPQETKAYHAVALDDVHSVNRPALLDIVAGKTEEVWFAGDHLGVGGGHMIPYANVPTVSDDPLQYIVQRASQNGLEFKQSFIDKLEAQKRCNIVSAVHNQSRHDIPVKLREARKVIVKTAEGISAELPLVHESVVDRMNRQNYFPIGLMPFQAMKLVKRNGTLGTVRITAASEAVEVQNKQPKKSVKSNRESPKGSKILPDAKMNGATKLIRGSLSRCFTPRYDKKRLSDGKTHHSQQSSVSILKMQTVSRRKKNIK
ncbi:phospholipase effector Tle1 domain-containing protein [Candidatus Berkiella aquae]|uniref:DUF2235 domain-containing protein n=1 Tax=Candidatus Berkiella aquae TaxID=295108 RepID=A0A0Q9YKC4_9GAMM|nr:DUF2235 domain-containing protein [Candidatus Berkiella aquae]MCS5711169.1 DUF2235 domain-containing protein [Candidatus Berkiella aquae]